jgi:hypothetical protein
VQCRPSSAPAALLPILRRDDPSFDSADRRGNIELDGGGRMYLAPYRSGLGSNSGAWLF